MLNRKYVNKLNSLQNIADTMAISNLLSVIVQHTITLNVMEYTAILNTVNKLKRY